MLDGMHWRDQDPSNCSIARTLELVGRPWGLLILRELFRDVRRFDDIQRHLGVSEAVLTRRLRELLKAALLERRAYREPGRRTRAEYQLSAAGRELFPILAALKAWGDEHVADSEGPATVHEHRGCGSAVSLKLECAAGHGLQHFEEVLALPGRAARTLRTSS